MFDFDLSENDVFRLWKHFIRMDKFNTGTINRNDITLYVDERNYSIIAPFIERFFDLIEKEDNERITFEEFFPAIVSFCLFTKDEMVTCNLIS